MKPRQILYWSASSLLMAALYWRGLLAWFQKDDFAWLGLRDIYRTHDQSIWWILFHPLAQGTIRTLSERSIYFSFVSLFGLNPLPFRILAFVTCGAAATMLALVAAKLTGSRAVGFWASILWIANVGLASPMVWTPVFYQLAWSLFLLTEFWLLMRYVETGERRFFLWQLAVFVLSFFVLETAVVYPAIAAAYAIASPEARKRKLLLKALPLFSLSIIYTIIHFEVAPVQTSGPYQLFVDARIFQTLATYWNWTMGPGQAKLIYRAPGPVSLAIWALTLGLFAFAIRQRKWMAWFPLAWFLITILPFLPLPKHMDSEYLTAPALGVAMWGGWALVSAWEANWMGRVGAAALLTIYAAYSTLVGQTQVFRWAEDSDLVQAVLLDIVDEAQSHPGKVILLRPATSQEVEQVLEEIVYTRALRLYAPNEILMLADGGQALREKRAIVLNFSSFKPDDL